MWRREQSKRLGLREVDVPEGDDHCAQGKVHLLSYQMVDLESGWKINGVQIVNADDVSA